MPISIHGSSGNIITDATATALDVRTGYVCYNNSGKLVGTLDVPRYRTTNYTCPSGKYGVISGYGRGIIADIYSPTLSIIDSDIHVMTTINRSTSYGGPVIGYPLTSAQLSNNTFHVPFWKQEINLPSYGFDSIKINSNTIKIAKSLSTGTDGLYVKGYTIGSGELCTSSGTLSGQTRNVGIIYNIGLNAESEVTLNYILLAWICNRSGSGSGTPDLNYNTMQFDGFTFGVVEKIDG